MTAEKMLSLFSGEEGLAVLWRLPSLGRERRFGQAAISRILRTSPGRSASLAEAEAGLQSGNASLAEAEPRLEGKATSSEGAGGKLWAISLAEGEAVRRALKQAALPRAGRLLGNIALEEAASSGRRLFPAGTLAGGIAREASALRAAEAALARQGERLSADGRTGGFSGGFPGMPAAFGKAGGGNRAEGQRLRQAASGREMLLARSIGFLRGQESGDGDFDSLLSRLERQLAMELGAG